MVSRTTQDYKLIEEVMKNYVDGANGDLELLRSTFLPTALINGLPIQELYDIVEERGETNADYHVELIDVVRRAANVKIIVKDWHGYNFVEFFHLVKMNDDWMITSKTGTNLIERSYG